MDERSHDFLRRLLETPSPSGFERPIQDVVREWAGQYADEVRTDRHGNVVAALYPQEPSPNAPRVLFAGHCDQIGLMVQYVDAEGFLYVQPIGGWDVQILLGQYLTVWAGAGPVQGVVSRQGTPLAHPGGAEQGAAVHRPVGGHRREEPGGGRAVDPSRRPGDDSRSATARSATASPPRRPWTTRSACGS